MAFQTILVAQEGAACVITLNRPSKKNAFSRAMKEEVLTALGEAERDPAVRAVVFTGGTGFFSSGQDLNEALEAKKPHEILEMLYSWQKLDYALEELAKPVLAAIEGFCITGGMEFAMACDIRICAEDSTFAITSSRIGTVPGAGGTIRLPRLVGQAKAMEILFSAEPIDAAEALRIGLVNHVVPKGRALGKALELVKVYEKRGPLSLTLAKRAVRQGMQMNLRSAIDYETFLVATVYGTEDKNEGIAAFLEKREARFKGR
ncbi:MAG: enoyl-CoA hydratase/isomerase family protein [Candidatus Lambdaproteobacteria bacterium]|nr:enoyl-CoA hydratase/isomerase family protein [Candidatus Lambdaproteobacteria bacterium]